MRGQRFLIFLLFIAQLHAREDCALLDVACHARNVQKEAEQVVKKVEQVVSQVVRVPQEIAQKVQSEANKVVVGMQQEFVRLAEDFYARGVSLSATLLEQIRVTFNSLTQKNEFYGRQADVRHFTKSFEIGQEEQNFLQERLVVARKAVERFLGESFNGKPVPRIGICCSGGGFRAMCALAGAMKELETQGLLDMSLYVTTLSGATWAIAPWSLTHDPYALFYGEFKKRIASAVLGAPVSFLQNPSEATKRLVEIQLQKLTSIAPLVADVVIKKLVLNDITKTTLGLPLDPSGVFSVIDLYGILLGASLFSQEQLQNYVNLTLTSLVPPLANGKKPLPIFTAVYPQDRQCNAYDWYEFTPFEVSSYAAQAAVPAWAWGRPFKNGTSVGYPSPVSLGECMAIFGSAFSVTVEEVYHHNFLPAGPLKDLVKLFIDKSAEITLDAAKGLGFTTMSCTNRPPFGVAWEHNFMYGLPSYLGDRKLIPFVDAGIAFGVPIVPLLYRDLDLIIVFDVATGTDAHEFLANEDYARAHGLAFPAIDRSVSVADPKRLRINEQVYSIFKPENGVGPTIVYIPLTKNPNFPGFDPRDARQAAFLNTFNLSYTPEQVDLIAGLYAQAVREIVSPVRQLLQEQVGWQRSSR